MTAPAMHTTASPSTTPAVDPHSLESILAELTRDTDGIFAQMDWADDEIDQAIRRHPAHADILFHVFALLNLRDLSPGASTEFVYRGHAREILDRLAAGADTRPATAAEICLAATEISKATPVNGPAFGLYLRLWRQAFPSKPIFEDQAAQLVHYEQLHSSRIDDLEREMRQKLADPNRVLRAFTCKGRHHTIAVRCRFTA